MPRGRAPKPLEKAGQVGLGNVQTKTELYLYKIAASILLSTQKNGIGTTRLSKVGIPKRYDVKE